MMLQELRAGAIFYICHARAKKIVDGPYRLEATCRINQLMYFMATRLADSRDFYLLGHTECIKVGSVPNADR